MPCTLLRFAAWSGLVVAAVALALGRASAAPDAGLRREPNMPASQPAGAIAPMPVPEEDSANARWLAKPVLESRLLDDMEGPEHWEPFGPGKMSFTRERCRSGSQSIRLVSATKTDAANHGGRPFAETGVRRRFAAEDWRPFNRLSVWVYPAMPGFHVGSVLLKLSHEGDRGEKLGPWVSGAMNHVLVKCGQWNHVVWEIEHLPRQGVTGLELIYRLQGNGPGAAAEVSFDFDRLELQRVPADHFAGWSVAPGRIAYCHIGYVTGSTKTALASDLKAERFELVEAATGKAAFAGPVAAAKTGLGDFQVLDFSALDAPGEYVLRAGEARTRPFRISPDAWHGTIGKVANFFYCERCGAAVPTLHGICHGDIHADHAGRQIVTNGGWHDAGDLSQGEINTAEAVHAMLCLAEHLAGRDAATSRRLIDEAAWGLRWLLKTRFGDGSRVVWQTMDFWSDGVLGNADDDKGEVADRPYENFIGARAEALAARVLKGAHDELAREALAAAKEDWQFALKKTDRAGVELAGEAALAAVELYRTTGQREYADRAAQFAGVVLDCQQTALPDWDVPLTGFFYTSPKKDRILNFFHRGHDQAPAVALAALCEALPDHADWIRWYAAVVLHSEYQRAAAEFNRPYRTLPAGIYAVADNPAEVSLGVRLSETHRLRRFAVIGDWRGHFGVLLSQTKALSAAARLRGDADLADLCQAQLRWVIGGNPFCQSTMYGEGHDFAPQYTPMLGNCVGSLPVGIQYRGGTDAPYWPPSNCWVYKEVWVHPAARWLWILSDISGPAVAAGRAEPGGKVVFRPVGAQREPTEVTAGADGHFRAELPQGQYEVIARATGRERPEVAQAAGPSRHETFLPGGTYELDLRAPLDFTLACQAAGDGEAAITVKAAGEGRHRFALRAWNLDVPGDAQETGLAPDKPARLTWRAKVRSLDTPWVAVVIADGDLSRRKEAIGYPRRAGPPPAGR